MFDAADLIALPRPVRATNGCVPEAPAGAIPSQNSSNSSRNRNTYHVVQACPVAGDNVALAMSDGQLCYARVSQSRVTAVEPDQMEERRWPDWTTWPSRHGNVQSLRHDPAHDALVTLEQATTAAGEQAFLGRYHRKAGASDKKRKTNDETNGGATKWVGCSIPLATSQAMVAVCASRGWAAVCTGSVVNLWAVAHPGPAPPNARRKASGLQQAPVGFEHALSVDLAGLVGATGGSNGRGASQIALLGNLLAVATDHAVFLVHLSFRVKGEPRSGCSTTLESDFNAPAASTARGDAQSPTAPSPQAHPPRSSPRDKSTNRLRGPSGRPEPKDFQPKLAARGGPSGKSKGLAGVDEGGKSSVFSGFRKEGGKSKTERRDGIVERAISEAEDLVVCVLHPGGEQDDRETESSAQPPPLLRSFDDDWEAIRTRREYVPEPLEPESAPLVTEPFSTSLPVSGNSTVLDRMGVCDVVLARRVGPGEVVKELHLFPIHERGDSWSSDGEGDPSRDKAHSHPVDPCCRFVLLTSKGATVSLVRAALAASEAFPASGRSPGRASPSRPRSSSFALGQEQGRGSPDRKIPPVGSRCSSSTADSHAPDGGISAGGVAEDSQQLVVFLRQSYRFNNDMLVASITSAFLFVLTVEGVEVWTYPAENLPVTDGQERKWSEDGRFGDMGVPLSSPAHPPPRPCLLHVQKLEVDGVLPRSPARCMVPLGGATPGLLLFPPPLATKGATLAFLAHQCQRRLRSPGAADEPIANGIPALCKPPSPTTPLSAWPGGNHNLGQDCWPRKFAAWRNGFCGLGGNKATEYTPSPLALFLRLRSPTEAVRLLYVAEECSERPHPAKVSAMFLSAAEGLHNALTFEVSAAWRAAVGLAGTASTLAGNVSSSSAAEQVRIETILPGLVNCWRLQRVAARCASLLGQLLLETALSAAEQGSAEGDCATGLAYTRACSWLLASGEPVIESFASLQDVAARVSVAGGETELSAVVPSFVSLDDDEEENSYLTTAEVPPLDLGELLPRAMYEIYLLPYFGVRDTPGVGPPRLALDSSVIPISESGEPQSLSLDDLLSGLVSYLHGEDIQRLSLRPGLPSVWDGTPRYTPLSTAVVYASRAPWTECPVALSQALLALDEQDKTLTESASSNISSSSGSSGASLSKKTSQGGSKRLKSKTRPRHERSGSTEHQKPAPSLDGRDPTDDETTLSPTQEWIAVARAILSGYLEQMGGTGGQPEAPRQGRSALAADSQILQLACERHPTLVAPLRGGAGPLARDLLAAGRVKPVVAALVTLTSCGDGGGRAGCGEGSFGPHKARELLQLKDDCFSPKIDPLQALYVFGAPGRQIAERLDSFRRASLDLSRPFCSTIEARPGLFHDDAYEQNSEAVDSRPNPSETKALAAAARDFLSLRCSASLAKAALSVRHQERISQALGAPEAWRASLARTRALDRAVLRYLISAHLDDLRALENSAAGNPKTIDGIPTAGTGRTSGSVKSGSDTRTNNHRDREYSSWADAIVPLLSGQVSRARGAEEHVDAILRLVREITRRGISADNSLSDGNGRSMNHEVAEEVVTEAKRRLPATELSPASAGASVDYDGNGHIDDDTQPWGSGGEGTGKGRAPWPWGPRAVPASAVGAILALAAALPPAGKLLAGIDVMLQVGEEVVAAAKAESAAAAGAAASGSTGKGSARAGDIIRKDSGLDAGVVVASVEEVSCAAERALLLYAGEYCGKDPDRWASVTEHVRNSRAPQVREGGSVDAPGQDLVRALLQRCGAELGGQALVRALPENLDLMDCLDEIERSLLGD
ncbi:unnamed protein product [Ectocarpus sp. 12 AP-2014]